MPFKEYQRVLYRKNPLLQVICQLRFPRILKINEKAPADFQEMIRRDYPLFDVSIERQQQFTMDVGVANDSLPPRILQSDTINNYQFATQDKKWRVNLTSTFLALSTTKYDRWEDFREKLKRPVEALETIYNPPFYERVGLRYIDAFKRSELGLENTDWTELIEPFALGFMSNPEIREEIKNQNTVVELDIGDGAVAQINIIKGFSKGIPTHGDEESFIVDSDMYVTQKKIGELEATLSHLHDHAARFMRAVIKNRLHEAMGPREI